MKKILCAVLSLAFVFITVLPGLADGYTYVPPVKSTRLPRSTPLEKGVNPVYIANAISRLEEENIEMHSLMIAVDGEVIYESYWNPYGPDEPHILHSLTKLFTNAAVGVAISEGYLTLDTYVKDVLGDYFPENPSENLNKLQLKHLVTMTSGIDREISGGEWRLLETSWLVDALEEPCVYEPGTHYMYSSSCTYLSSAMVQATTGMTCYEYLLKSGFSELGMEHFTWDLSPEGICSGGNGVTATTEDILKIGQLYLNLGEWNGKQILTEDWCRKAIGYEKIVPTQGTDEDPEKYAIHWWAYPEYYGSYGKFGQTLMIVPEINMVICMTAANDEYDNEVVVRDEIVRPVLADYQAQETLEDTAKRLNLLPLAIVTGSPISETVDGKVFKAEENEDGVESIRLDFSDDSVQYTMTDDRGEHVIINGIGKWNKGETTMTGSYLHHSYQNPSDKYVAYAEWLDDNQLQLLWFYPNMTFQDKVIITFDENGESMSMVRSTNVNSAPTERPAIELHL